MNYFINIKKYIQNSLSNIDNNVLNDYRKSAKYLIHIYGTKMNYIPTKSIPTKYNKKKFFLKKDNLFYCEIKFTFLSEYFNQDNNSGNPLRQAIIINPTESNYCFDSLLDKTIIDNYVSYVSFAIPNYIKKTKKDEIAYLSNENTAHIILTLL